MNYLQVLNFGTKNLQNINSSNNYLDSELLLADVLNLSREKILINLQNQIQKKQFDKFKQLIKRRSKNEPVAYIIKKKEFWKYEFYVNKNVLIPRPETELIVEECLKLFDQKIQKKF
jgi:Methylase of polypeptide chain release factors